MSIQRIDIPKSHTHGHQARAYLYDDRYLSAFFADQAHGGPDKAKAVAKKAERVLNQIAAQKQRLRRMQDLLKP